MSSLFYGKIDLQFFIIIQVIKQSQYRNSKIL